MAAESKLRVEGLLLEHRQVVKAVEDVREFLKNPRPEIETESSHHWGISMAEKLKWLNDQLLSHFRDEESSEILDELSRTRPHISRMFENLQEDHGSILADFNSILEAAMSYSEGRAPENPQLRRRTLAVLERLAHHEHQETELLQRALYVDTGSKD